MTHLRKDFIERRVSHLAQIPDEWEAGKSTGYKLNFKMCQIKKLRYDFHWGDEREPPPRSASIVMMPSKILVVDLSLNELQSLDHQSFEALWNLRSLDASLNRIETIRGVEVLKKLFHLNLANNLIRDVDPVLGRCKQLHVLDLSTNRIESIQQMPRLTSLVILHLNDNKLKSLDGIQSLSHLRELYVHRNQLVDISQLVTSFKLSVLNASQNNIAVLYSTVEVIKDLRKLQNLYLHSNPIANEPGYNAELVNNSNISILDNVSVRQPPKVLKQPQTKNPNVLSIKEAAQQAFYDAILEKRRQSEEQVRFLQERIRQVQRDFEEWEDKTRCEMQQCASYLDALSSDDVIKYDPNWLRETIRTPTYEKPWEQMSYIPLDDTHARRKPRQVTPDPAPGDPRTRLPGKEDYTGIKKPDEVLRHTYNELAKEYTRRHGSPGEQADWS